VEKMSRNTSELKNKKRELGSFYTPPNLARQITFETLNRWLNERPEQTPENLLDHVKKVKILDPAVGAGVFLLVASEWLEETRQRLGEETSIESRRKAIATQSIYGVDIENTAVETCRSQIMKWVLPEGKKWETLANELQNHIIQGNSLTSLNWQSHFSEVLNRENPGFDVVLGNPPYGNLLSEKERQFIQTHFPVNVGTGRHGTWNSAAHFIVKSNTLLRQNGEMGFLIPNSILRVKQFTKIREYILKHLRLWKIIDEGSPFDDVTLEMVTIFCTKQESENSYNIKVESRRPGHIQMNSIPLELLQSSRIFPIYYDEIFEFILKRGNKHLLYATRGRDIPHDHVSNKKSKQYCVPYITSGRSVNRYRIDERYLRFTDDWYQQNEGMQKSYASELLVATKNYKFPRCVIKPKGTIHGGGIVQIVPTDNQMDLKAIGLILNSKLIQYICTRYLTNYSQLTTCLNTGILEELPLVLPNDSNIFAILFEVLSNLYSDENPLQHTRYLKVVETLSEALVYELYFSNSQALSRIIAPVIDEYRKGRIDLEGFVKRMKQEPIYNNIERILKLPTVREIENRLE
jgi:hypothetical protein